MANLFQQDTSFIFFDLSQTPLSIITPELLGAPLAVLTDEYKGVKSVVRGDIMKGVEKILPTGLGSPVKAYREYGEGVTTGSNIPILMNNVPLHGTATDAVIRFFSFNPSGLSAKREREWNKTVVKRNYQKKRADIRAKIRRFFLQPIDRRTSGDWAELLAEINNYNERVRSKKHDYVPQMTTKQIRLIVKKMHGSTGRYSVYKLR